MTQEYSPIKLDTEHTVNQKQTKLDYLQQAFLGTPGAEMHPVPLSEVDALIDSYAVSFASSHMATKKPKLKGTETVADVFGLPPLTHDKNLFLCGCEFEIECVANAANLTELSGIHVTTDGSLKYQGYEFISKPAGVSTQLTWYKNLMNNIKFEPNAPVSPFNERTSTHVHVNVQLLNYEEVTNLLYLYILVEQALFNMAKPERQHNIHCVPLRFTCISQKLRTCTSLPHFVNAWAKYSALNLSPMKKLGTVEFRHMHGMDNADTLRNWLENLEALYKAAVSGMKPSDIVKALYQKRSFTDVIKMHIPGFNLYGTTEAELSQSGILLKQIVMGKI